MIQHIFEHPKTQSLAMYEDLRYDFIKLHASLFFLKLENLIKV